MSTTGGTSSGRTFTWIEYEHASYQFNRAYGQLSFAEKIRANRSVIWGMVASLVIAVFFWLIPPIPFRFVMRLLALACACARTNHWLGVCTAAGAAAATSHRNSYCHRASRFHSVGDWLFVEPSHRVQKSCKHTCAAGYREAFYRVFHRPWLALLCLTLPRAANP